MDVENRIGVTESEEISYNLDAFDRLYKGNIIITKRLTDKLIEKQIYNTNNVFFVRDNSYDLILTLFKQENENNF